MELQKEIHISSPKVMEKYIYLRCALFKLAKCKATCKLKRESNKILLLTPHNDKVDESDIHELKILKLNLI